MTPSTTPYTAYSVSWNLTQRCNLECAHCYMSAHAGADTRGELTTAECRRVIDEIAAVNPHVFLILTGGEPLLRRDIWDVAAYAADKKFTTVFGTNGVLLREREARQMREHGVLGASIRSRFYRSREARRLSSPPRRLGCRSTRHPRAR